MTGTSFITLTLPTQLAETIEAAAGRAGMSPAGWLVDQIEAAYARPAGVSQREAGRTKRRATRSQRRAFARARRASRETAEPETASCV